MNLLQCGEARRASKAAVRREKLVEVARKLFAEQGFHNTGVAQIAAVSGIKVGQIYRDFTDKEAIVADIVERDLSVFLNEADLEAAVRAGDVPAIRAWIRVFADCSSNRDARTLAPEILAEAARNERIATIAHAINRRVKAALLTAIAALAPDPGRAAAHARLAELILTMGAGLMHRRIADPDFDEDAAQAALLRLIDDGIGRILATPAVDREHAKGCSFMTMD